MLWQFSHFNLALLFSLHIYSNLSFFFSISPLFGNLTGFYEGYGQKSFIQNVPDFQWCTDRNDILLGALFYLLILICAFVCLYYYLRLYWYLKSIFVAKSSQKFTIYFTYPLVLFISWAPAIVDYIYMRIYGDANFWILLVHMLFTHSQGL